MRPATALLDLVSVLCAALILATEDRKDAANPRGTSRDMPRGLASSRVYPVFPIYRNARFVYHMFRQLVFSWKALGRTYLGRKPDPERKEEMLGAVVDYLLRRGLHELSLRPLGTAIGVSPRVLIYHFGSKERLVSQALSEASVRQREMFERWAVGEDEVPVRELLMRFWRWISSEETRPYLKLFFEVYVLGLQGREGFSDYPAEAVTEWIAFVEEGLAGSDIPRGDARSEATILVAAIRGMLLDLMATGERNRVDAAMERFARQVGAWSSDGRNSGCQTMT